MRSCPIGVYSTSLRRSLLPIACLAFAADARVLQVGNVGEPGTFDPHHYTLRLEKTILNDLFVGLATSNAEGNIVPGVAQRWTASEDGLTWTFELRRDATWSDGHPLTAHDFVFAFRRLLDPETDSGHARSLYPIRNAKAVNVGGLAADALGVLAATDHTLVIELARPFPSLAERLSYPSGYPLPVHVIEERGEAWTEPGTMVSNGAFVLEDREPWSYVRLGKNAAFQDADSVALEGVVYRSMRDANAAYYQYRSGELDAIGDFPAGEIAWVREHMPGHLRLSPMLSIVYLVFNVAAPPFEDVRLREALSIALDRQRIVRVLGSAEMASVSLVPPMVTGYASALAVVEDRPARLERARRLLREAGFGKENPLTVTLCHVSGVESTRVNIAIAAMWQEIGVTTILDHEEREEHLADLRQGTFQVAKAGWFGEDHPEHYLDLLVSDAGDVNYGRFTSGTYDTIMRRAQAERLLPQRLDLLRDAEVVGLSDYPVAPLYTVTVRALVNPRIEGWHDNPRNIHGTRYLRWKDDPGPDIPSE